jgi:nicotinamide-nucleotide amidase
VTKGDRYAETIASLAVRSGFRVGVAESLTCGKLAAQLGAAPDASEWFRGGVVAYASEVKFDVLGVAPGPVVTAACARQMAAGAAKLLGADATVAVTGVGGPEPEEGEPAGTVYVATWTRGVESGCERLDLDGDPPQILAATTERALALLLDSVRDGAAAGGGVVRPEGAGPGDSSRATAQ